MKRLLAAGVAAVAATGLVAGPAIAASAETRPPSPTVLADDLVTPLSTAQGPRGTTFVTQNFAGLLTAVHHGGRTHTVYSSPGDEAVSGVSYDDGAVTFAQVGAKQEVWRLAVDRNGRADGKPRLVADTGRYERRNNPDRRVVYGFRDTPRSCLRQLPKDFPGRYHGKVDSNPYATARSGSTTYIADAGGNDILAVNRDGRIRTVAVLPAQPTVVTRDAARELKLPRCVVGETYWFEPVPTDVEVGPRGHLYVSTLPGGPEDDSLGARGAVYRIDPRDGDTDRIARGFAGASNLAVSPHGTVYVTELFGDKITQVTHRGKSTFVRADEPAAVEWTHRGLLATINALTEERGPADGELVFYRFPSHHR
ncbi:ScyD/ScyE family protein [Puerhibacterium sp. TATVAM-FAB25]|uniref:ScyD/ScyE family protein n=1 Tax=Puerhibacterium sp. TATVAM-FAB25 TaxID=3093699 RepID=UPI00397A3FAD